MRLCVTSTALAAAYLLMPVAVGYTPGSAQDFSITNQVEPVNPGRRDIVRQLQEWWDVHAYYPRHASSADEEGNVKLHLVIYRDGRIWSVNVAETSGSSALDAAGIRVFTGGFLRPFPEGAPDTELDISLHYVLAHRHDQPVAADYVPVPSRRPFTIANDPVRSPILDTMLQKTCTGEVVKQGVRNHPAYGVRSWAQAIFFRKPDGTPWVSFYEGGFPIVSPVTEIGKVVQWTGREEHSTRGANKYGSTSQIYQYTLWPDGENKLSGSLMAEITNDPELLNRGGTVDFTCAKETVPPIKWSAWSVTPGQQPIGDPP